MILFVECLPREPELGLSRGETLLYQNTGPLALQSECFALRNGGTGSQDALSWYQSSHIWLLLRFKGDLANTLAQGDFMWLLPRQNCCDSSFGRAVGLLCWLQTHLTVLEHFDFNLSFNQILKYLCCENIFCLVYCLFVLFFNLGSNADVQWKNFGTQRIVHLHTQCPHCSNMKFL